MPVFGKATVWPDLILEKLYFRLGFGYLKTINKIPGSVCKQNKAD